MFKDIFKDLEMRVLLAHLVAFVVITLGIGMTLCTTAMAVISSIRSPPSSRFSAHRG